MIQILDLFPWESGLGYAIACVLYLHPRYLHSFLEPLEETIIWIWVNIEDPFHCMYTLLLRESRIFSYLQSSFFIFLRLRKIFSLLASV